MAGSLLLFCHYDINVMNTAYKDKYTKCFNTVVVLEFVVDRLHVGDANSSLMANPR